MGDVIRYLTPDGVHEIAGLDPMTTVLDYLRDHRRRCGTKEGCNEGDCGACTVVLGEAEGDRLRWRAVNACIQFIPALDGKLLLTVEDLAEGERLHPVQQALVDAHGSQCGFCTPGFVMSLFALFQAGGTPDRAAIDEALAGNLCRCTGYRPIVAAARAMLGLAQGPDRFAAEAAATAARLRTLGRGRMLALEAAGKRYFAPVTESELAEVLDRHPDALILAGGTDVGLWVTKQRRALPVVVSVAGVGSLQAIETTGHALRIGAAATYAQAFGPLTGLFPALAPMLRRLGSAQIRNAGTLGGNIANGSPIGDSLPALIALGAELVLRAKGGERRLPLQDLFLGYRRTALRPGEYVARIDLPLAAAAGITRIYKISKRFDQDISAVLGAFWLRLDGGRVADARVAFGGMAATPKRAPACEAALIGQRWSAETAAAAAAALDQDFAPLTDFRASADYRRLVARNLVLKLYLETADPAAVVGVSAAAE